MWWGLEGNMERLHETTANTSRTSIAVTSDSLLSLCNHQLDRILAIDILLELFFYVRWQLVVSYRPVISAKFNYPEINNKI